VRGSSCCSRCSRREWAGRRGRLRPAGAVSPALTYYSRFYIQESLFVFFALGFLIALGRYVLRPGSAWAVAAGLFAGLAYSTKETSLLVLPAALVACVVARAWSGESAGIRAAHVVAGAGAALAVAIAFYTSFFQNPSGIVESVRAFSVYLERGVAPGPHAQPWHYYLGILAFSSSGGVVWSEGLILALALVGAAFAFRDGTTRFWPLYICLYSVMAALVFSAVRYKTPWNLLPFYTGFVLLAGAGATALLEMTGSLARRTGPGAIVAAAFIGSDPGHGDDCDAGGRELRLRLLWALTFSIIATLVLQEMSARLGVVTGRGPGRGGAGALRRGAAAPAGGVADRVGDRHRQRGVRGGQPAGRHARDARRGGRPAALWVPSSGDAFALLWSGRYRAIERVLVAWWCSCRWCSWRRRWCWRRRRWSCCAGCSCPGRRAPCAAGGAGARRHDGGAVQPVPARRRGARALERRRTTCRLRDST
jgi:hypothetical protein